MDINFRSKKLEKQLTSKKELNKMGTLRAKLLKQRLTEIEASPTLSVLKLIPGPRLHPLKGNRKGQLSVDLDHPYRLLFVPNHDPVPELDSGGFDWGSITAITITGIADTHE